jgi:hypothetical protein
MKWVECYVCTICECVVIRTWSPHPQMFPPTGLGVWQIGIRAIDYSELVNTLKWENQKFTTIVSKAGTKPLTKYYHYEYKSRSYTTNYYHNKTSKMLGWISGLNWYYMIDKPGKTGVATHVWSWIGHHIMKLNMIDNALDIQRSVHYIYLSLATVQHHSKFARLRTASVFASASFEVRKTSDGCIRNCPCEPTLSESFLRTWLRSSFLRTWLRSSFIRAWLTNLCLPNLTYELDWFHCKCFVTVHQGIAWTQNLDKA